jgi:hypothetical protein
MTSLKEKFSNAVGSAKEKIDFNLGLLKGIHEGGKEIGKELTEDTVNTGKYLWSFVSDSDTRDKSWDRLLDITGNTLEYGKDVIEYPEKVIHDAEKVINKTKKLIGEIYSQAEALQDIGDAREKGYAYGYKGIRASYEVVPFVAPWFRTTKIGKISTPGKIENTIDVAEDVAQAARRKLLDEPPSFCQTCPHARLSKPGDGEIWVDGEPVSTLDNVKKGNFGETMADTWARAKGWGEPLGRQPKTIGMGIDKGIDGIFINPHPPPGFLVVEAKYGSSQLNSKLADGTKQMDDAWIIKRLNNDFPEFADDVLTKGYERIVLRVDASGNVKPKILD